MKLSKNFDLKEFTKSETAETLGLTNAPAKLHLTNLRITAMGLEQVRKFFGGSPVTITSGYRSPALNEAVGGVSNSDHALATRLTSSSEHAHPGRGDYACLQRHRIDSSSTS